MNPDLPDNQATPVDASASASSNSGAAPTQGEVAHTLGDDSKTVGDPSAVPPPQGPPAIPDHELLFCAGRGSYGEVWLARNVMGNYRAVKIVYRASFEHARPFEREFNGIKKFEPISRSHDGFVDVLQVGRTEDYFYYVMELADDVVGGQTIDPLRYEAKTLRTEIQSRKQLAFEKCVEVGLSLTAALGHLHKHGLLHRDIKPSNIIFVHGLAKLADIGLVAEQSEAKSFVGTEGFIPPEGPGTSQADIYSLGKVLYEIATGKDRHEFPALPTALGETKEDEQLLELNSVFLKACQTDVRRRYQTCEEMREDLLLLQSGKSVAQSQKMAQRLALLTKISVAGVTLTLVILAALFYVQRQAQREAALRTRAEAGERTAREKHLEARKNLYAADMLLAQQALRENNLGRVLGLLGRYQSKPDERDLRGWEWRYLWSQCQSDEKRTLGYHAGSVHALAFVPGKNKLATFGRDFTLRIWDINAGRETQNLQWESKHVPLAWTGNTDFFLIASHDGERLVAAGGRLLRILNVNDLTDSVPPLVYKQPIRDVRFTKDDRAVDIVLPGELRQFDFDTRQEKSIDQIPDGDMAVLSENGEWAAIFQGSRTLCLWNRITGSSAKLPIEGSPTRRNSFNFSLDATKLAWTLGGAPATFVWDVPSKHEVARMTNHTAWIIAVAFSTDGRMVATGGADRSIMLWDTRNWEPLAKLQGHLDEVYALAFSPDNTFLATGSKDGAVKLWSAAAKPREVTEKLLPANSALTVGGVSADASMLVSWDRSRTFSLWSTAELRETQTNALPFPGAQSIGMAGNGQWVAFGTTNGNVALWNCFDRAFLTNSFTSEAAIIALGGSQDGAILAAVSADAIMKVWGVPRGELIAQFELRPDGAGKPALPVSKPAISADGRILAVGLENETAEIFDLKSRQRLGKLTGHTQGITSVAISPDCKTLATASWDATVKLWDLTSLKELRTLKGQLMAYRAVTFSPDGHRVAAGGADGTIRLWDVETGLEVALLSGHKTQIIALAFTKDGHSLVSSSGKSIVVSRTPSLAEIATAEKSR